MSFQIRARCGHYPELFEALPGNMIKSRSEIQEFVGIKSRSYFSRKILNPLIKGGLIKLTIPDKPKSPKQKYYSGNR